MALCVADIGHMNDAIAGLQWSRRKGALTLYHHAVGVTARRTAAAIAGTELRTVDAAPGGRPIGTERAALDERALVRLRTCDEASLVAIETAARTARERWRADAARAWRGRHVRVVAEWHTAALYAYHMARWARASRRRRRRGSATPKAA